MFKYINILCSSSTCEESNILKVKIPAKYPKLIIYGFRSKNITKKLMEIDMDDELSTIIQMMST